jgi:double-stranded uracil-DNA glycosylase
VSEPKQVVDDASPSKDPAGDSVSVLPDVLVAGVRVVFCGTAVGTTSARRGAYYSGPGNQFWSVLARVGLTPHQLAPAQFTELPNYGIGLTDLAKYAAGTDEQVSRQAFDTDAFRQKIEKTAPRAVAFNGKRAAETVLARPVSYGRQSEQIGPAAIFVLPSTSGAARGFWDESYWLELAQFVTSD